MEKANISAAPNLDLEGKQVPQSTRRKALAGINSVLIFLLGQWLVFGLGLACLLAYLFPHVAAHGGVIHSQYTILYGAVAVIFLISGLQINKEKLVSHLMSWRLHLITQIMSFMIIPAIFAAIVQIILAAKGLRNGIDVSMLVGTVALSCLPTTISSNIVFTRNANGDDAAAMIEVVIGNVLGPFITPSLILLFLPHDRAFDGWSPVASSGLGGLYRKVFQQIGLSVLIPLAVGQMIQWRFPIQTAWVVTKFYLAKISTFCLILLVWSTFSSSFATSAFKKLPHATVICNVFLNLGTYLLFSVICFYVCRPPKLMMRLVNAPIQRILPTRLKKFNLLRRISRKETIAVCFCGAAKTTGLGIPIVAAMWSENGNELKRSLIEIPVVLYTTEQIFVAQALVWFFKRWESHSVDDDDDDHDDGANTLTRS